MCLVTWHCPMHLVAATIMEVSNLQDQQYELWIIMQNRQHVFMPQGWKQWWEIFDYNVVLMLSSHTQIHFLFYSMKLTVKKHSASKSSNEHSMTQNTWMNCRKLSWTVLRKTLINPTDNTDLLMWSRMFLFWCFSYLSRRVAAGARFGSRFWHLDWSRSVQVAATAGRGGTPTVSEETFLLLLSAGRLWIQLSCLADLHCCGEMDGRRWNQQVTSHSGWRENETRKREKNH